MIEQPSAARSHRDWTALTDEELIAAYRTGESADDATSELLRRYQPRIASWCLRFTQDRDAALDLVQDILLRAFRSLHTYRGDSRFSTWLYVIARNQCASVLERRAGQPAYVDSSTAENIPDTSRGDIHQMVETEQLRNRKWRMVVSALTRTEANILMLHYGEDVSLGEITRHLGLTNKSGAKAYIVSARRKLSPLVQQDRESRAFA